jgi:transposase InsO family protein
MVEHAVLEWVHWFNNRRSLGRLGFVSPREFEQQSPAAVVGLN